MDDFAGLSVSGALERARAQGRPVRVLRPGSEMTSDLRPDRLNLHVDADGELEALSAG
ncbi:I78 family peptidase inhibitor [Kineococcus sp. TBRC 1896]|uniref:I78 family peptidase inhibitor n=1 Tax=Kineococcus mangrovi TaxID=1660183 RepID=A0ABV4I3K2_9ACTN